MLDATPDELSPTHNRPQPSVSTPTCDTAFQDSPDDSPLPLVGRKPAESARLSALISFHFPQAALRGYLEANPLPIAPMALHICQGLVYGPESAAWLAAERFVL
jgi:hypothetical protein